MKINISGISESRVAPIAAKLANEKGQSIIVVSSDTRGKRLASDLSFFAKNKKIILLPSTEMLFLPFEAKNQDDAIKKLNALKSLSSAEEAIVIAPISTFIKKVLPREDFVKLSFNIELGDELDLSALRLKLQTLGYEKAEIIEGKGQYAFRGGILDIFTLDTDNPYRIEFFGNEVDSIRSFSLTTQRSLTNEKAISISPAKLITYDEDRFKGAIKKIDLAFQKEIEKADDELKEKFEKKLGELKEYISEVKNLQFLENYLQYFYDKTEYIWEYMKDGLIMIDDPDRIYEQLDLIDNEQTEDFKTLLERGEVTGEDKKRLLGSHDFKEALKYENIAVFTPLPKSIRGIKEFDKLENINARQTLSYSGKMNVLEADLISYAKKEFKITIVSESDERITNLKEFVDRIGLSGKVNFEKGALTSGIEYPETREVWISENDIFLQKKKTGRKKHEKNGVKYKSFQEMREGDYVVHENHGIGQFIGIGQLKIEGERKDYIKIKYAGNDMLYVPCEQMDMVQKYIGGDSDHPKIYKLSGTEWKETKTKAKNAIMLMAKDLIDLYAKRSMSPGYAFSPDTVWQKEFEELFPYVETEDQLRSIEEIKRDMEKPTAMDRLLLGDVGFGKTEVASRAMFKCLSDGKQAAMLVPTTILANQHYYTLKERFEKFPFKVEVLSRFKTEAQQKEIVDRLKKGTCDLVIGTHRLLSEDVGFKDLGLLVIDEEQRFGVEDKENIKKLKNNVDVLTLSATPIPRTLNMSMSGIKDMSLIEEPPEERYPVQTYVLEDRDEIIKEVIQREIGRSGQAFVVFNRVRGLGRIKERIEKLAPNARVAVAHGQMNQHELEAIMLAFVNGEYDVLVSTTIIESGLDIPNANTMIVLDSDRYGLAQLYQMRGRVGRSNRIAYCYLMYQRDKVLNELATKRLSAIKEFTEFGSGFKIAMKDLEIRGAGNLLGTSQSGHMSDVGYELYCRMVDNAVRALKGEYVRDERTEISIEIPVTAYISNEYIPNEALKMEMYKRIASVQTFEDEDDVIDELLDRFGDVPNETINLVKLSHLRYMAEELGVSRIYRQDVKGVLEKPDNLKSIKEKENERLKIMFNFESQNGINAYSVFNVNEKMGMDVLVNVGKEPFIRLSTKRNTILDKSLEMLQILMDSRKTN